MRKKRINLRKLIGAGLILSGVGSCTYALALPAVIEKYTFSEKSLEFIGVEREIGKKGVRRFFEENPERFQEYLEFMKSPQGKLDMHAYDAQREIGDRIVKSMLYGIYAPFFGACVIAGFSGGKENE